MYSVHTYYMYVCTRNQSCRIVGCQCLRRATVSGARCSSLLQRMDGPGHGKPPFDALLLEAVAFVCIVPWIECTAGKREYSGTSSISVHDCGQMACLFQWQLMHFSLPYNNQHRSHHEPTSYVTRAIDARRSEYLGPMCEFLRHAEVQQA